MTLPIIAKIRFYQSDIRFCQNGIFNIETDQGDKFCFSAKQAQNGHKESYCYNIHNEGNISLRANNDDTYSKWTSFNINKGDIIDVRIVIPNDKIKRVFSLFFNKSNFLSIEIRNKFNALNGS